MPHYPSPDPQATAILRRGVVIPAHPLALTPERKLDERHQRALTRYYCAAGAGGLAVGVHTTQFAIRDPQRGLYEPVLQLARETADAYSRRTRRRIVKVAGVCGDTAQAVAEAQVAAEEGYDLGLLSLAAIKHADDQALLAHCRAVAEAIPLFGFYLQPAVGGRRLGYAFWREFAEIANVMAIKMAPFDRYQTLDVVRAVAASSRADEIALYTGNDDHIILDLLTPWQVEAGGQLVQMRVVGGLLGHWACWTRRAVEQLEAIRALVAGGGAVDSDWLRLAVQVTDANAALFDPQHDYAGCIAGIHEVLRRQGLLAGRWCLDPSEGLSPGQMAEIDRVYRAYPQLNDDAFVAEHLDEWLS